MNRMNSLNLVLTGALLLGAVLLFQNQSSAQSPSFYRVFPFATAGGQVGFFDQQTGKVYIYDDTLETCVLISQLQELGAPMAEAAGTKKR